MNSPLLEARGLVKSYDDGRIQALRGVEVRIEAGEYVAISGPSGSGKSTLLHLLGGLDEPTEGEVMFKGDPLGSAVNLDSYRSRQVGFIFQAFYLLPTLRAVENVQVAMLAAITAPTIGPYGPRRCLKRWVSMIACAITPTSSQRESGSAWPLREPSPMIPRSCWPMNPPAIWTQRTRLASWISCAAFKRSGE